MNKTPILALLVCFLLLAAVPASSQSDLTADEQKRVEKAFDAANDLYEKGKPREALKFYNEALQILPTNPTILFNAGMAAFESEEFEMALDLWKRLKIADPDDWRGRAKLIQVYHTLKRDTDIKSEREELFALRKSGRIPELTEQDFYCREQFRVGDYKIMVLEHFELKGNRALKYAFMISKIDMSEEFRISLGSYDMTNSIWRRTTKPTPKDGERLYHLDGYYKWGHATYGMYPGEPSYDAMRARVIKIVEGKDKPASSTTVK